MTPKSFIPIAAGAVLFASSALANADTILITPEQEVVVREYIVEHPIEPMVEVPSDYELSVGSILPDGYEPGQLVLEQPLEREYQYVNIAGRTALIDPATREVVYIFND